MLLRSVGIVVRLRWPPSLKGAQLRLVAPGEPRGPPVDICALAPGGRHALRCDPGVERAVAVVGQQHESGLAVGQDQLSLGQAGAIVKKTRPPAVRLVA